MNEYSSKALLMHLRMFNSKLYTGVMEM